MSTAQDLPLGELSLPYGEPTVSPPLRLVPVTPLDFDDAVKRVRPRLQRYAVRRLGDAHEAEELVQEALLRAYTHRDQLLTEEDLSAWTTVVTGRLVIDRLRVRGRSISVADVPEGARVGRDTADVVVARDEARTALDALDAMPARQAALLWAREVEGRSYQDLCDRFAMTEPAVRSVLTRARKALRKEYALRGGTLPVGGLAILAPWIAGLSVADKLRRVVTRITAPAALGAIGITALGGLILSPLGIGSNDSRYNPSQAVVTSSSRSTASHQPTRLVLPAKGTADAVSRRLRVTPTATGPTTHGLIGSVVNRSLGKACASNKSKTDGAGGTQCDPARGEAWVYVPLPTNVTGQRQVGVEFGVKSGPHPVTCSDLSAIPVAKCSSQGVPQ